MIKANIWITVILFVVSLARSQVTFQNLNFEAAHDLPPPGGSVAVANALPGWSAFSGTNELSTILYNNFAIIRDVALYGSNSYTISGYFSVMLNSGGAISQVGSVPADAKALFFKQIGSSLSPLSVALSAQNLSFTTVFSNADYTLFGADVSAFAGQTTSLVIFAPPGSLRYVDDFEFSPQLIPEPSSLALLICGGLLLTGRRLWVRTR